MAIKLTPKDAAKRKEVKIDIFATLMSFYQNITLMELAEAYKDDTGNDLEATALSIGYSSSEAMLQSKEYDDIIVVNYDSDAQPTYCAIPTPQTQHLWDAGIASM
ncbi:hypothetical protein AAVH_05789 [Aphelenchoides avenae]|nr:hypothetical protein AAVH_05789 [Aphelenchus avenae]